MHASFHECFVDPKTGDPLTLEIAEQRGDFVVTGTLRSAANSYPIVRGIPRFVPFESANYSQSFGYQWHKWPQLQFESQNVGKPMEGHTRSMWERITGRAGGSLSLKDRLVLDIGCGPGRFVDVARAKGARVIGMDYSAAVEIAAKHFLDDPNVCICQADALNPPFKEETFDGAFSIGVLHHTPDPQEGVRQAKKILKSGGWLSVAVYEKGGYYDYPQVQFWRRLFKTLWPILRHYPPLLYTYAVVYSFWPLARAFPPLGKVCRLGFPFVNLPDINWSLLDTFDSVTPSYQSAHESFEVFSWFQAAGFKEVEPTNWGTTSYRGVK